MFRTLAALIVVGSLASTAVFAAGPGSTGTGFKGTSGKTMNFSNGGQGSRGSFDRNYHLTHGTRFDHGYFYRGRDHFQWSYRTWNSRYGCFTYWDPCTSCNYYWCQPYNCFYPVTYCPCGTYCWQSSYVVLAVPVDLVAPVVPVSPPPPPPPPPPVVVAPAVAVVPVVPMAAVAPGAPVVNPNGKQ